MLKPITIWKRFVLKDPKLKRWEWEHNHIEDNHIAGDKPIARFKSQRGWKNSAWQKILGYLKDGVVWTPLTGRTK